MPSPTLPQRLDLREKPDRRVVMHQKWRNLFFAHWRWDPDALSACLPQGLHLDTFEGEAWLGLVPFRMCAVRPAFCPPLPWLSWFIEVNLRTYVHTADGTPGVWFFSLDCQQPLAVRIARKHFYLNYIYARQQTLRQSNQLSYYSQRADSDQPTTFSARLDTQNTHLAEPGTLEFFLTERYLFFTQRKHQIVSGRVWHSPYLLQPARLVETCPQIITENHLHMPDHTPDHLVYSPGVDVTCFALQRTSQASL